MAIENRSYGKHIASCIIGGTDWALLVQEVTVSKNVREHDVSVLVDTEDTFRAGRASYRVRVTIVNDHSAASDIATLLNSVGNNVDLYILTRSGGIDYGTSGGSGTALLVSADHGVSDAGQTITFELIPNGTGGLA